MRDADVDRCSWCGRVDAPGSRLRALTTTDAEGVLICEMCDQRGDDPRCVFCDRGKDEARLIGVVRMPKGMTIPVREAPAEDPVKIPAAAQAYICRECVELCRDILREGDSLLR